MPPVAPVISAVERLAVVVADMGVTVRGGELAGDVPARGARGPQQCCPVTSRRERQRKRK